MARTDTSLGTNNGIAVMFLLSWGAISLREVDVSSLTGAIWSAEKLGRKVWMHFCSTVYGYEYLASD